MYVVTVALNQPRSVDGLITFRVPHHCINMKGTSALGTIECDEPSLTAVVTPRQSSGTLVNNTESTVVPGFGERTVL